MKRGLIILAVLAFALLIIAGCEQKQAKQNETNLCPSSCDDSNKCTSDFCSAATNYRCENSVITPCCGNRNCETGEMESCPQDCQEENALLKDFVSKAENVKSYKYTYDDGADVITISIKDNLTKQVYFVSKRYNGFLYDSILINRTENAAYLYCTNKCDTKTTMKIRDYAQYLRKTPVELLKEIKSAKRIRQEIIEGDKPSTVLEVKREDGNLQYITVWELYGLPLSDEVKTQYGNTLTKVSYREMKSPLLDESFSLPLYTNIIS